ncbi:uncharacterized protein LOC113557828 [Rhopalosiphum maidis]|uniref:uncharacterized protein LOC113557828 n=1 Tax=Rhopalosiphum maidis TaxID=43146 RepID=UPI000EFE3ED0|nr:uncharacterized protein LOC113557828 [Rhopalosiphum maidis]
MSSKEEYRTVLETIYPCQSINAIQTNIYFRKRTSSITEMKGNFTLLVPFDDSLTININLASWSLTGGWKPNLAVFIAINACSSLKTVLGNVWYSLMKAFNFPKTSCPLLPIIYKNNDLSTYITSGIDLKEFEDHHNFPKVYFYGKHKVLYKTKNIENKVLGCFVLELSLICPREYPI